MKFDWVARFRETNSIVKSVSSSKIYKISRFSTCIIATNYRFAIFLEKLKFSRVLHVSHLLELGDEKISGLLISLSHSR